MLFEIKVIKQYFITVMAQWILTFIFLNFHHIIIICHDFNSSKLIVVCRYIAECF